MKRLPAVLAALVVVYGCAGVTVEPSRANTVSQTATSSTAPSVATTTTTNSATTTTVAITTTTSPQGPPVAWIAPSGVPVAVTGVNGESVEVLTPCGNTAVVTGGTPIYEVDVVIDPGHGGPVDTGAVAGSGLTEKYINRLVGLAVHDLLAERGISSLLTRTGDYPIPIRTRSAYSDLVGARALVSIHHNSPAAPSSDIPGVEIFVEKETPESARLGGLLFEASMDALSRFDVAWQRAEDAGVMTVLNTGGDDAYGMVRLPTAPTALVELGYLANPAEAGLYEDPAYLTAVSLAVTDAIEAFLTTDRSGAPLVEGRIFDPASGVGRDQCIEPDLDLALYPRVVDATVTSDGTTHDFAVTMSSPYDSPERYADAFRVIGDDGEVYGVNELAHDHATEQPFTRTLAGVELPASLSSVTIQGRDQVYGWGGETLEVTLP